MIQCAAADAALSARHGRDESRWKRPPAFQSPLSPAGASAIPVPPRPSAGIRFTSDDLDEVRAEVQRHDGEHSRVVHGRGRFGYERHLLPGRLTPLA